MAIAALEASVAWLALTPGRMHPRQLPAGKPSTSVEVPGWAASDSDSPNGWWQAASFYVLTLVDLQQPEENQGAFAVQEHNNTFVLAFRVCCCYLGLCLTLCKVMRSVAVFDLLCSVLY